MVEISGKVVMWGCLAGLAGLVLALVGVRLRVHCGHVFVRMVDRFHRLPLAAQIVVAAFVLTLIVHGSTKPTNGVPPSASSPATLDLRYDDDEPSSGVFSLTELSDVQLAVGVALAEVRTNEVHDFAVPENAIVHIPWLKRGASADVFPLVLTNWCFRLGTNVHDRMYVSASGTISFGTPMASAARASDDVDHLAPFHAALGVVPEANWNLLATEDSGFWHAVSPSNTALFTWNNVLFGRDTNFPVTVQAELSEDGDVTCRYDLSSLAGKTNWIDRTSIGVWNNRTGEVYVAANHFPELDASAPPPLPTTILFRHLLPTDTPTGDRDGDGLSTADELFVYRTDPDRVDTDCDGVGDYDEVLRGTNPRLADTDGDLYRDATDFNPTVVDGWLDGDGDGLPDEWKSAWFGTNAVEALADADGDGISNLAALHMGVAPTGNVPDNFAFATGSFAPEVNAHGIVPNGFDFACPSNLTTLLTRTLTVERTSPWQQLFVSASPHFAAGWSGGASGCATGWTTNPRRTTCRSSPPTAGVFRWAARASRA